MGVVFGVLGPRAGRSAGGDDQGRARTALRPLRGRAGRLGQAAAQGCGPGSQARRPRRAGQARAAASCRRPRPLRRSPRPMRSRREACAHLPLHRRVPDLRRGGGVLRAERIFSDKLTEIAFVPTPRIRGAQQPLQANAYDDPGMWFAAPASGVADPARWQPPYRQGPTAAAGATEGPPPPLRRILRPSDQLSRQGRVERPARTMRAANDRAQTVPQGHGQPVQPGERDLGPALPPGRDRRLPRPTSRPPTRRSMPPIAMSSRPSSISSTTPTGTGRSCSPGTAGARCICCACSPAGSPITGASSGSPRSMRSAGRSRSSTTLPKLGLPACKTARRQRLRGELGQLRRTGRDRADAAALRHFARLRRQAARQRADPVHQPDQWPDGRAASGEGQSRHAGPQHRPLSDGELVRGWSPPAATRRACC